MKVVVNPSGKDNEIKYPCLMIDRTGTEIVLFYRDRSGVIINGKSAGSHLTNWYMDLFTPFTGTVELSND